MSLSKPLHSLSESLSSHIRSGFSLSSLVQCIDELVLNSIDARATSIAIHVDLLHLSIKVTDNGVGISKEDMEVIGERYSTSKCHFLNDLEDSRCYGYRGEALSSLKMICGKVEIISRPRLSPVAYIKRFHYGIAYPIRESLSTTSGTTVVLNEIFHSLPVRRKSMSELIELEKIRQSIATTALIHPSVSFTFTDSITSNGKILLHTKGNGHMLNTFSLLFSKDIVQSLKEVTYTESSIAINGFISTSSHHSKGFQFIYINKRLLHRATLHSHINKLIANSLIGRSKQVPRDKTRSDTNSLSTGTSFSSERFGVYVLNIQCSKGRQIDISFDISINEVVPVLESAVRNFLKEHHLSLGVPSSFIATQPSHKGQDISFGVHSHSVQRIPALAPPLVVSDTQSLTRKRSNVSARIRDKLLASNKKPLIMSPDPIIPDDTGVTPSDSQWSIVTGPDSKPLYINKATGNCQSVLPLSLTDGDIGCSYGCQPLRAGPHLTHGYSPLLPRPKHLRPFTTAENDDESCLENDKWRDQFLNWSNPAFRPSDGPDIMDIGISRASSSLIKVHDLINSYKFTSDMLSNVKVIGQVDSKFIACTLKTEQFEDDLVVLFDQHAVHERIRLETLTEGAYDPSTNCIKSVRVNPPVAIQLNETNKRLALLYINELGSIGVTVSYKCDGVLVSALPAVLMEREQTEKQKVKLAEDLILNHLELLCVRGGGGGGGSGKRSVLPLSIHKVLCSVACHGAIKFGNPLSIEQCSELIATLSKCKLPYQCAHGRPSLAPALNLSLLKKRFPIIKPQYKLNLSKLLNN